MTHNDRATPDVMSPMRARRANKRQVIIAPATDPYRKHQALVDLARAISLEVKPPQLPEHSIGRKFTGTASAETRADWIEWVDLVARRWPGPLTAQDLRAMSGAPMSWCVMILEEWRALLERGLNEAHRRSLVLSYLAEAEAISREALALIQSSGDEQLRLAGLRLALESLKKRQNCIGFDRLSLEPRSISAQCWQEQPAVSGLTMDELRRVGEIVSRALSREAQDSPA